MEIVAIERKTFEELVAKFDRFVSRMDAICHRHGEKRMSEWMDNQVPDAQHQPTHVADLA